MKRVILGLSCLAVASSSFLNLEDETMFKFMKYIQKHNKSYETPEEFQEKFEIFKENLEKVNNEENLSPFMDMTSESFKHRFGLNAAALIGAKVGNKVLDLSNVVADKTVDWREKGIVTSVKDQGQCGSCWAFSAIGNIESQYAKNTGKALDFSEQELVDCDTKEDQGCNGGLMDFAFTYFETHGVELASDYKYTARQGKCKYDESKTVTKVKSYNDIGQSTEEIKKALTSEGPIAIAVDASDFQFYSGGVLECTGTPQLNHGVLLVGYNTGKDGKEYYIVKNSWGTGWGNDGYIYVRANDKNDCGIHLSASTAVLDQDI